MNDDKNPRARLRRGAQRGLGTMQGYVRGRINDVRSISEASFDIAERVLIDGKYEPKTMLADALALSVLGWSTVLNGFRLPPRAPQEVHGEDDEDNGEDEHRRPASRSEK